MRLGRKLLVLFTLISFAIVLSFGWAVYIRLWDEKLLLIRESISHQIESFDFSLNNLFVEVEGDLVTLINDEAVRSRDDGRFTNFLNADEKTFNYDYTRPEQQIIQSFNAYRAMHPHVSSVYMGRENGSFVRSHPRERPTQYDPRTRPWYTLAKANPEKVMMTDAYPSLTSRDINLGVVKALSDETGAVFGVVGIDITLVKLTNYFLDFKIHPAGKVLLVDEHGVILADTENRWTGKKVDAYSPNLLFLSAGEDNGSVSLDIQGKTCFLFHQKSSARDWRILVVVPSADIEKELRGPVLTMVLFLSSGLVLLSILTLSGLKLFVIRPIHKLTRETEVIARTGDLDRHIDISSRDEIGDLASAYNGMTTALGKSQKALLKTERDLTEYREHLEEKVQQRTRELQNTLKELAVARDRAESADRLKSAFLATMSHELRTPLNSIIGFSGILRQGLAGPLNEEQLKQMGMVCGSAEHLLALINDVLDLSKIEAGQLQLFVETFDLRSSIETVLGIIEPLIKKKDLALHLDYDSDVSAMSGDKRRVEQILLNLLSNAVKFTEKGFIRVEVSQQEGCVTVGVTDTGLGIKEQDLGNLFKPFSQLDSGINRRHEGTGLGLSICKKLAELHGGVILVTSAWGKGSTFGFKLPISGGKREDSIH